MAGFPFCIARYRYVQRALGWLLPKTASYRVAREIRVSLPLKDEQGPAYFLMNGGPEAFYHYEKEDKAEVIKALPFDGVFLDIGANIGLFTFHIANLMPHARCIAFEPHPILAACLRESAAKSPFPNVEVQELAVAGHEGQATFHEHRINQGGGSMVREVFGATDVRAEFTVKCQTLDAWAVQAGLNRIDVIKLDAQGAEGQILKGATNVIRRFRPTIVVEIDYPVMLKENWKFPEDYKIRRVGEPKPITVAELFERARNDVARGQLQSPYVLAPETRA